MPDLSPIADETPWVRAYRGVGPTDAFLVRDWLLRNGMVAQVRGEGLLSIRGDIPISEAWPAVWVPAARLGEARRLIDEMSSPTLVYPPWTCARCGEENPPPFASCWSCGADAPNLGGESA